MRAPPKAARRELTPGCGRPGGGPVPAICAVELGEWGGGGGAATRKKAKVDCSRGLVDQGDSRRGSNEDLFQYCLASLTRTRISCSQLAKKKRGIHLSCRRRRRDPVGDRIARSSLPPPLRLPIKVSREQPSRLPFYPLPRHLRRRTMAAHLRAQSLLRVSSSALRPSAPSLARSLQTTADSCSLVGTIPDSPTEPFQIKLHPEYFQTHRCDTPSLLVDVTKNSLVEMYQQMITMRRMEMAADQLYKAVRSFSPSC